MNPANTINADEIVSRMTDAQVAEVFLDKDGWQPAIYDRALREARNRKLNIGDPSKENAIATQSDLINMSKSWILDRKPVAEILDHLVSLGQPAEQARSTVTSLAIETSNAQIKIHESERTFRLIICVAGVLTTVITFLNALNGGTYVLAWGAILFGGIRAFFANKEIAEWEAYLQNAQNAESETLAKE